MQSQSAIYRAQITPSDGILLINFFGSTVGTINSAVKRLAIISHNDQLKVAYV